MNYKFPRGENPYCLPVYLDVQTDISTIILACLAVLQQENIVRGQKVGLT